MLTAAAGRGEAMTSSPTHAPNIFLSYSSSDRDRALALADALEAAGVPVWIDRASIVGGTSWGEEIVEGIKGCAALVILCTERAMASRNVRQEIQLAWRYERPYLLLGPVAFRRVFSISLRSARRWRQATVQRIWLAYLAPFEIGR